MRSKSIWIPHSIRAATCSSPSQEHGIWFRARIENAVGTTQLTVSGNRGQPYLSGSKRTWRSEVRNFHFHSQFDSLPAEFSSQRNPCNLAPAVVCGEVALCPRLRNNGVTKRADASRLLTRCFWLQCNRGWRRNEKQSTESSNWSQTGRAAIAGSASV